MLAAEPLYLLFDIAVVGRLGALPLAGLAVGGLILSLVSTQLTFLSYGTTARAARLHGAGRERDAVGEGVQATWLAAAIGFGPLAGVLVDRWDRRRTMMVCDVVRAGLVLAGLLLVFPAIVDTGMMALRYSQPNPAELTDPATNLTSSVYNVGEQMKYRTGVEATADERWLRYDALIQCSVWELINA